MTVSGTRVSLAAAGSDVVIGSSTEALAPYITAGFGTGSNGTELQVFVGGAKRTWDWREIWWERITAVVVTVMIYL